MGSGCGRGTLRLPRGRSLHTWASRELDLDSRLWKSSSWVFSLLLLAKEKGIFTKCRSGEETKISATVAVAQAGGNPDGRSRGPP